DYVKLVKKDKRGVSGGVRLAAELAVAGAVMAYLYYSRGMTDDVRLHLQLPFTHFYQQNLILPPWLYAAVGALVVVGTANAGNLADGLAGLAIGPSIMNAGTFLIFAYIAGVSTTILARPGHEVTIAQYLHVAHISGVEELAVFAAALFGAGVGFLWYNAYP